VHTTWSILCCRDSFDAKLQIEVLSAFMTEQAQTPYVKVNFGLPVNCFNTYFGAVPDFGSGSSFGQNPAAPVKILSGAAAFSRI